MESSRRNASCLGTLKVLAGPPPLGPGGREVGTEPGASPKSRFGDASEIGWRTPRSVRSANPPSVDAISSCPRGSAGQPRPRSGPLTSIRLCVTLPGLALPSSLRWLSGAAVRGPAKTQHKWPCAQGSGHHDSLAWRSGKTGTRPGREPAGAVAPRVQRGDVSPHGGPGSCSVCTCQLAPKPGGTVAHGRAVVFQGGRALSRPGALAITPRLGDPG